MNRHMKVYLSGKLIVVESNVMFGLQYWADRRRANRNISWEIEW